MRLLMHLCCAPCGVYPIQTLLDEGVQVEGFFYNPNIHPLEEYERRRDTVREYAEKTGLLVAYREGFMQAEWEQYPGCADNRCRMCYAIRMDQAAAAAKAGNYDAFTTSLLVSPYQKHDLIRDLAERAGQKHGVRFEYRDFRPGFRQGQQMAKDMGLYRQKYCACIHSLHEREQQEQLRKQKRAQAQKGQTVYR